VGLGGGGGGGRRDVPTTIIQRVPPMLQTPAGPLFSRCVLLLPSPSAETLTTTKQYWYLTFCVVFWDALGGPILLVLRNCSRLDKSGSPAWRV
jgi:hypothetical protein